MRVFSHYQTRRISYFNLEISLNITHKGREGFIFLLVVHFFRLNINCDSSVGLVTKLYLKYRETGV
jgi:hypothetical protein